MVDYKKKSKESFDKQASTYDKDFNGGHARKIYKRVLESIGDANSKRILDVGCGTGNILNMILNNYSNVSAHGIDISDNMLEKAKEKLKDRASLVLGDSENLPYESSMFDIIICNDSFHHYPNPKNVLKEFYRVLKINGILILGDCWQPPVSRTIMNVFIKFGITNCGDVKMYSETEICTLLRKANFKNVEFELVNDRSYLVKSIK
ncbi:class I SAM-dependent methyltransferase [Clostridium beijerinckii]|uniref:class I SAM-dependent methyltransferase n=1 Tax=Clostridium beijerinckii TaxID=1520 RepID=UPI00098C3872|nr:class I SAM-dependent methyltransferase [Clostridium beijerinckii]NRT80592.1 ubiquinone/menaquinone biosynthesis C-methylase UbiE [Clostridium beijerinckii]OOM47513.1 demethylmenaquinone methyltransferase [Clostridium beijerinckii]